MLEVLGWMLLGALTIVLLGVAGLVYLMARLVHDVEDLEDDLEEYILPWHRNDNKPKFVGQALNGNHREHADKPVLNARS
jgi:hypothetical protein